MTGMSAVAMSPKAGAHGEQCGMMAIKAAIFARGEAETRKVVLAPESAHGTNPATAALIGFSVRSVPATPTGIVSAAAVRAALAPDVAAIMLTNPNTCGLFEREIVEIAEACREAGAYFYCDGANFNAIVGKARPGDLGVDAMHINLHKTFSTPHGGGGPGAGPVVFSQRLAPFAPVPYVVEKDGGLDLVEHAAKTASFGRMTAFHGQMGMFVRALAFILSHGAEGLKQASEDAVLAANYLRARSQGSAQRAVRRSAVHARSAVRRPLAQGHGADDARFRQGDDRRGLSSDDRLFPARRSRRNADRADRVGSRRRAWTCSS